MKAIGALIGPVQRHVHALLDATLEAELDAVDPAPAVARLSSGK